MTLAAIVLRAQAQANRDGKRLVILNLNTYSPLYVIRDYWDGCVNARGFVCAIFPESENA